MNQHPTQSHEDSQKEVGQKPSWFRFTLRLCVFVLALGLTSCNEMARDMGLEELSDIDQRVGIKGTETNPTPLDPFKKYTLVMAANECRFFTIKVPHNWFWRAYLTVANPAETRRGQLKAEIARPDIPWAPLPGIGSERYFDLGREGVEAAIGIGNRNETRTALIKLCQQGAPLHITIESQISATTDLMGPEKKFKRADDY